MNKAKIHPDIMVEDLVEEFPKAAGLLLEEGIVCIQCGEPVWGTLKEAAERKGITDIDRIVEKLNASLQP
jgi:methionine synthase II (cobalamin-independent)